MDPLVEQILEHNGVKGMRWGQHLKGKGKTAPVRTPVVITKTPGKRVKTSGGTGQPASVDAVRAAAFKQKAKSSTTDSLSDQDLKALVNRMNMEQQYDRLRPKSAKEQAAGALSSILLTTGKQQAQSAFNNEMTKRVKAGMG